MHEIRAGSPGILSETGPFAVTVGSALSRDAAESLAEERLASFIAAIEQGVSP